MQRLLPVAAAALLAFGVWILLDRDAVSPPGKDFALSTGKALAQELDSEALESTPEDESEAHYSAVLEASERIALEAGAAPEEGAASAAALWRARIHLARIDGTVDERPSGNVSFIVRQGRGGQLFDGEVSEGVLSFQPKLRGAGPANLAVSYGEFGDVFAWNEGEAPPIGQDSIPTILLLEQVRPQLEVFEWGTERSIPEVDLVLHRGVSLVGERNRRPDPSPKLWKTGVAVPYAIEVRDLPRAARQAGWQSFFVGAPGFAWAHTTIDLGEPRHRVELQRGGSLRVVAQGLKHHAGLQLTLVAEDTREQIGMWPLDESGQLELDGLRAGPVRAMVISPDPSSTGMAFGEVRGTVVPGEVTELRCALDPLVLSPGALAELRLELEVPAAWGRLPRRVDLVRLGGANDDGERRQLWIAEWNRKGDPWTARLRPVEVPPGRWQLRTQDPTWAMEFQVSQEADLRLAIPEPVESTIEVVDAQTQERLSDLSVYWQVSLGEGRYASLGEAKNADTPGLYTLRSPPIDLRVHTAGNAYTPAFLEVPSEELGGWLKLELERSQGVSFRLRISDELDYGESLAWETEVRLGGVHGEDAALGKGSVSSGDSHHYRYSVAEPGSYALCVPDLPGFEPVGPLEIEIPAGEFVEREIWLVKRP